MKTIRESYQGKIKAVYIKEHNSLRKSCQFKKLVEAKKQFDLANKQFQEHKFNILKRAKANDAMLVKNHRHERNQMKLERDGKENEVLEQHQAVANQASFILNMKQNVCAIKTCRAMFSPGKQVELCHVQDCSSRRCECGCTL